ncbi:MAG: hypothetical protein WKG07_39665 [Hymenobacter sp.]
MWVFAQVSRKVVDEQIPAAGVRGSHFCRDTPGAGGIGPGRRTISLSDTRLDSPLAFLLRRYAHLKQFSANFLRHITFASAFHGDRFAQALAVVVELQTGARRKLPADAPTGFITPRGRDLFRLSAK